MATPTQSDRAASGVPVRSQEKGNWGDAGTVTYATTATGEVTPVLKVVAGTTVLDAYVLIPVSLGAGTQIELGDGADADRYVTVTTAATAGYFRMNNVAAGPYTYTVDDTIDLKMSGGTATGVVKAVVIYTRDSVDLS